MIFSFSLHDPFLHPLGENGCKRETCISAFRISTFFDMHNAPSGLIPIVKSIGCNSMISLHEDYLWRIIKGWEFHVKISMELIE